MEVNTSRWLLYWFMMLPILFSLVLMWPLVVGIAVAVIPLLIFLVCLDFLFNFL
jgi:hypothetical protein